MTEVLEAIDVDGSGLIEEDDFRCALFQSCYRLRAIGCCSSEQRAQRAVSRSLAQLYLKALFCQAGH